MPLYTYSLFRLLIFFLSARLIESNPEIKLSTLSVKYIFSYDFCPLLLAQLPAKDWSFPCVMIMCYASPFLSLFQASRLV